MEEKKCPVLHDGKQCGLPLTKIAAEDSKHNGLHECPRAGIDLLFFRNPTRVERLDG